MSIPDQVKGSPSSIVTVMFLETFFLFISYKQNIIFEYNKLDMLPFLSPKPHPASGGKRT